MKLLTQGDDFGFTRGVTLGIIDSIDKGILRNTGMFTNMPSSAFAASFMKDRPHVCFGVDFNIVAGKPVSNPKDVPALVDENGFFHKSGYYVKLPEFQTEEGRRKLFPKEQVKKELQAQFDKFVELSGGKKPGYVHPHSICPETYLESIREIAKETGVCFSMDMHEKYKVISNFNVEGVAPAKFFDPVSQLNKDSVQLILDIKDKLEASEYAMVGGHPGYVDSDLLKMSTLSIERAKDAEMMMSEKMINWVKGNNIELITYYDLVK